MGPWSGIRGLRGPSVASGLTWVLEAQGDFLRPGWLYAIDRLVAEAMIFMHNRIGGLA